MFYCSRIDLINFNIDGHYFQGAEKKLGEELENRNVLLQKN